jgi:hypothetical protein
LQLQATIVAIVENMALFDSRSDMMMFKRTSIPKGIQPSRGCKRKITGINACVIFDHKVILENITLPEFSSAYKITGPIWAIVINNAASLYDMIIGMDVN